MTEVMQNKGGNYSKNMTQDVKMVDSKSVSCDGGSEALGHPRVYLEIKHDENSTICPYCGKMFIYEQAENS